MTSASQEKYWNKVAWDKTFTHPLNMEFLPEQINNESNILDYGCGYGRTLQELSSAGFNKLVGVDTSSELLKRAGESNKGIEFIHVPSGKLPFKKDEFDCVLLFAVLTCIPRTSDQMEVIEELHRVLRKGGVLYLSDYYLQQEKNKEGEYDKDGVFESSEGAVFRHHTIEHFKELFSKFDIVEIKDVPVVTLHGNKAEGVQYVLQR